jgi:endoribonuclease Dicer
MVEAYVGALFVDSNFDYNEVQRFFDKHMKPYFEDMSIYDTFANNHPTVSGVLSYASANMLLRF